MWQVHVIIQEIFLNGAVHKDGRLFPGDQLVSVRPLAAFVHAHGFHQTWRLSAVDAPVARICRIIFSAD